MYLCFFRVASHGGVVEVSWSEMLRMKVMAANEIFADLSKSCSEQICVNDNETLDCVLSAKTESETCLYGYDWHLILWHGRRNRCTTLW